VHLRVEKEEQLNYVWGNGCEGWGVVDGGVGAGEEEVKLSDNAGTIVKNWEESAGS